MSFVAAAATVGGWAATAGAAVGLTGTAGMIAGGAMIGAGVGGAYSALTGDGKILDSMLTGATLGGLGGWGLGAAGLGTAAGAAGGTSGVSALGAGETAGTVAGAAETAAVANPAVAAYGPPTSAMMPGAYDAGAAADAMFAMPQAPEVVQPFNEATGLDWSETGSGYSAGSGSPTEKGWWESLSGPQKLATGLGATTLLGMLGAKPEGVNVPVDKGTIRPYEYKTTRRDPVTGKSYYFEPIQYDKYGRTVSPIDTSERNYFNQGYTALPTYKAAEGGQVPRYEHMAPGGLASIQSMRDGYGATQTPDGNIPQFAAGGIANMRDGGFVIPADAVSHFGNGSTDAGLKLLGSKLGAKPIKGRGDGMSDSIPATINGKQPARIADGEAYVPPEVVKKIGKGSTEAGAKRLYNMMDKVRHARTGTKKQGKQIKAAKYLPA